MRTLLRLVRTVVIALLSVSWCALQSLLGGILFLIFLPHSSVGSYRGTINVYHNGGLSFCLGIFCFISNRAPGAAGIRSHLYGHFLQSCIFGPFYLFTVVASQLFVRIPFVRRRRLERGLDVNDILVERKAAQLAARFGE